MEDSKTNDSTQRRQKSNTLSRVLNMIRPKEEETDPKHEAEN
jgi:hypothetical protein